MELGFSREQATFILSLVALIGLVGSFFVGYMDERLGTKKSMLFFGIWYALSLLANATENTVLVYVSIFMIGMSIGAPPTSPPPLPPPCLAVRDSAR